MNWRPERERRYIIIGDAPACPEKETSAFTHATRFLFIDDAKGRAAARQCGIAVVGIAGILLAAKARGKLAAASPVLDELSRVGYWLSDRLIAEMRTGTG